MTTITLKHEYKQENGVDVVISKADAQAEITKTVTIPAMREHQGIFSRRVTLEWVCPECGLPRGDVFATHSYDGSRRLNVDGWTNLCGHIDFYADVREEALVNGLNGEQK